MNGILIIIGVVVLFIIISKMSNRGINHIDREAARELTNKSDVLILDVRTPQEYSRGHIKKAINIPLSDLDSRIGELTGYKKKPILVYCHSGARSMAAIKVLLKNSFSKAINLKGGFSAW